MTEREILEHFDHIDGIQKAQMLVLKLLLSQAPDAKAVVQRYSATLRNQEFFLELSLVQQDAMLRHLKGLT